VLPNRLAMAIQFATKAWSTRRDAQIRFLKLQVEMLGQKLPGNRVILSPEDRRRLIRLGGEIVLARTELSAYTTTFRCGSAAVADPKWEILARTLRDKNERQYTTHIISGDAPIDLPDVER